MKMPLNFTTRYIMSSTTKWTAFVSWKLKLQKKLHFHLLSVFLCVCLAVLFFIYKITTNWCPVKISLLYTLKQEWHDNETSSATDLKLQSVIIPQHKQEVWMFCRYISEILPIRDKTLYNQSINQSCYGFWEGTLNTCAGSRS